MAEQLGVRSDQVARLRPSSGERVLHRVGNLLRRDTLCLTLVEEAPHLVEEPLIAHPSVCVEPRFDLCERRVALLPNRGLHLSRLDERNPNRSSGSLELDALSLGEGLDRELR